MNIRVGGLLKDHRGELVRDKEGKLISPNRVEVYLDGKRESHAIMADDRLGQVIRYVTRDGALVVKGDVVLTETKQGHVEFKIIDP